MRLLRGGKVIASDLEISNLKHFKEEVDRIESGKDCGLSIISNVEVKVGDEFECYKRWLYIIYVIIIWCVCFEPNIYINY